MSEPILIGVLGKAGAGKDTVADWLAHALSLEKRAFAAPVYAMANSLLNASGVTPQWADREWKERGLEALGMSPRHILQTLGTEWGRAQDEEIWVKAMESYWGATKNAGLRGLIVPDVRFHNEADMIRRNNGLLLLIERPVPSVADHTSEQADWSGYDALRVDNSRDLVHLYTQLGRIAGALAE